MFQTRHYSELTSLDKALHIVFPFLPLLWIVGLLPPLDALFPWLAEQALVLVLGGSPLATDLRLVIIIIIKLKVFKTFLRNFLLKSEKELNSLHASVL